jgi:hypothetical protein
VAHRFKYGEIADDRECYFKSMEFAKIYLEDLRSDVAGVHLLFLGGYTHLGLTYRHLGGWLRRYSIVLQQPGTGRDFEFAFVFQWMGPLAEFCLHAHLTEELAQTLRWESA